MFKIAHGFIPIVIVQESLISELHLTGLDGLISVIFHDQLPHLIAQFLPIMDEIAGLLMLHHFGSLFFKDCNDCLSVHSILAGLLCSRGFERRFYSIKLGIHLCSNLFCRFVLIDGTYHILSLCLVYVSVYAFPR